MTELFIVDGNEVERYILKLSESAQKDGKLWRALYSKEDRCGKDQLKEWFLEIGLSVREDAVGNMFASIYPELGSDGQKIVITGSHIDTVRDGGAYDGGAGVVISMLAVKMLIERYGAPIRPLEVAAILGEEGSRYCDASYWGSRAIAGKIDQSELDYTDDDGITLAQAMRDAGYNPDKLYEAQRDDVLCYLETHIEQGPTLEAEHKQIGVVDIITGYTLVKVEVVGRADHAGTMPMNMRKDALQGACSFISSLPAIATTVPGSTITVGAMDIKPGSTNVIPGKVTIMVDIRSTDSKMLELLSEKVIAAASSIAERGYLVSAEKKMHIEPVALSADILDVIEQKAADLAISCRHINSGAGHDCQIFAGLAPAALMFIPSHNGRSHCPEEYTCPDDLAAGVEVVAATLYDLAWK